MVYYLSLNEKRLLNRRYLTWARAQPPSNEWRGWSWDRPPLEPAYDVPLTLHEVASQHCPTGRDVYLRRVLNVKARPSRRMIRGKVIHETVELAILEAKKMLYSGRAGNGSELYAAMMKVKDKALSRIKVLDGLSEEIRTRLLDWMNKLWDYETIQISSNLDRVLAEKPHMGLDALVNTAVPFVVERSIDGSFLGLSEHIRVDALSQGMTVLDLKTGRRREFQHLYTVGYALALEAELEAPVDVGVVVYLDMENGLQVHREIRVMDEALRREFVEERNRKMRIVYSEEDPGLPDHCPADCPFYEYCRG
ncbi:MAG: type I-A CRISPR-associated protein Cas4/Csa1 [Candidatus Korarchaeota archaeon]|nr:type I-A CRISPR-associated protein Cas4/Csa1 [Candidatus Korarchaeota archaeon]